MPSDETLKKLLEAGEVYHRAKDYQHAFASSHSNGKLTKTLLEYMEQSLEGISDIIVETRFYIPYKEITVVTMTPEQARTLMESMTLKNHPMFKNIVLAVRKPPNRTFDEWSAYHGVIIGAF